MTVAAAAALRDRPGAGEESARGPDFMNSAADPESELRHIFGALPTPAARAPIDICGGFAQRLTTSRLTQAMRGAAARAGFPPPEMHRPQLPIGAGLQIDSARREGLVRHTNNGNSARATMATGTGRFIINSRGRGSPRFHFAYALRPTPASASLRARGTSPLAAIPLAILALILGIFSMVLLVVVALVFAGVAFGIARWWLRRKAPRTRDAPAVDGNLLIDPTVVRNLPSREIAARVKGPAGSPQ